MTRDKAQKRAVRARMARTGERYTTARLHSLDSQSVQSRDDLVSPVLDGKPLPEADLDRLDVPSEAPSAELAPLPPRVAEPGMSEEAVLRATGKSWDEWFTLLDAWNGAARSHTEIARHVHQTHGIDGWWAQSVTVGYERARGRRALHERPDGFSVGVSKTFPVPVERLFPAIVEEGERARWLEGLALRLRTSQPNTSARFDILPGDVRLSAYFTGKGVNKSSVQFQVERLPDAAAVERWRSIWKEQFVHLAAYLSNEVDR